MNITSQPTAMELVFAKDGEIFADSREVAARFGKQHKNVLQAIKNLECSAEFNQLNFQPVDFRDAKGETRQAINMTRDGLAFLVMGFTGKQAAFWKERYIQAFNEMEEIVRNTGGFKIPSNMSEALRLAADQAEQIQHLQPKAVALDVLSTADGSLCVTDAAKTLQMRPKDLFSYLRSNGWVYRRAGAVHDCAYQSKITQGLLEHKTTVVSRSDGTEKITEQVRVTPKGLARLAQVLRPVARVA